VGKNKIQVRLENMADRFDRYTSQPLFINMTKLASDLFTEVNHLKPSMVRIEELSI